MFQDKKISDRRKIIRRPSCKKYLPCSISNPNVGGEGWWKVHERKMQNPDATLAVYTSTIAGQSFA
jgi:hypothetical protein